MLKKSLTIREREKINAYDGCRRVIKQDGRGREKFISKKR